MSENALCRLMLFGSTQPYIPCGIVCRCLDNLCVWYTHGSQSLHNPVYGYRAACEYTISVINSSFSCFPSFYRIRNKYYPVQPFPAEYQLKSFGVKMNAVCNNFCIEIFIDEAKACKPGFAMMKRSHCIE